MPRRLALTAALPAIALIGSLTACTPAAPSSTQTPGATATVSAAPSATPAPSATQAPTGTPVTITCDQLLTPEDLYAFNPNVGVAPNYQPTAGSAVAAAVADNGLACGWSNQTSGDLIEIAVAQPASEQLPTFRDAAASRLSAVPTYGTPPGIDGFFKQSDGAGEAQVFTDKYWLVARSPAFFEPGDAAGLIQTALSHLP